VTRPPYAGDAEYLGVCEERGFSGSERKSPYRRKIGGPWRAQFCSELAEGVSPKPLFAAVPICLESRLKINELTDEASVHVHSCLL
jgi:hypothetical protein